MNLTEWAKSQGVHPHTAYRWFREGTLPVPATRVGPRTILVNVDAAAAGPPSAAGVGVYARVSAPAQRADLQRQVARLSTWATQAGLRVVRVEAEVGSGMDGARFKARRLLADPEVSVVVVERRDRLGRVNTELVEAALSAAGRRLVVLDAGEPEAGELDDDLAGDMVQVLTRFCARRHGRGSARHRAQNALAAAGDG